MFVFLETNLHPATIKTSGVELHSSYVWRPNDRFATTHARYRDAILAWTPSSAPLHCIMVVELNSFVF